MSLRLGPWVWIVAAGVGCADPASDGESGSPDTAAPVVVPVAVRDALAMGGEVDVLVQLDDRSLPTAGSSAPDQRSAARQARATAWRARAERFVGELPPEVAALRAYEHLPLVHLRLSSAQAAARLAATPEVVGLWADEAYAESLSQSLPLIGQPDVAAQGHTGAGVAVAVIDTGADFTRADLGACAAAGDPGCRVVYAADVAASDGVRDTTGHGTNVSSIVARVAPDADIVSLDVFGPGGTASSSDVLAALDWVVANQDAYGIAVANLSLGTGGYTEPCATDVLATAVQAVRAAGVSVVASSGNDALTDAVASPACIDEVVSVGAVYDAAFGGFGWAACFDAAVSADQVACFSNAAGFLDVLAPGAVITAGGYTMGGTSMAAPHVSGALAVMRAADPLATVDEVESWLVATGVEIVDDRTSTAFPRLDLAEAMAPCVDAVAPADLTLPGEGEAGAIDVDAPEGCRWTASSDQAWLTLDTSRGTGAGAVGFVADANGGDPRTATVTIGDLEVEVTQEAGAGTIAINGGATAASVTAVTLTLWSSDAATMCVSNTATCSNWQAYATSLPWTLTTGAGTKTVYVTYRDANLTVSPTVNDTILLDTTKPTNGTVTAAGGTLTFAGFTDAQSGIAGYRVMQATGTTAPANCTSTTPAWSGTATSWAPTGLASGTTYAFRVCAVDGAGNVSLGATATMAAKAEYDGPVGTVSINAGAAYTRVTASTLTLSATDATGVASVCLKTAATACTTFVAYATSLPFTLPTGTGTKTVYATFKDTLGNVSTAVSDTIVLDTAVPANGTVTAAPGNGEVTLSFAGYTDALSGVASYRVMQATGTTAPPNCTTGAVWTGTGPATLTGLTNGTTYAFRACAVDGAGNVSSGATTTTTPRLEVIPPTGTLSINGDAELTNVTGVTLSLAATDDSGVTHACVSNTTSCTAYFAMTDAKSWTLPTGSGVKTVRVWYKDTYGNVSAPISDTITLDTVKPTNGTVTATSGDEEVSLTWAGFADANGISGYKVVYGTTLPTTCATGTVGYEGEDTAATVTGLVNGTTSSFRVCAVDAAGNVSTGATTTGRAASETVAPTGTIELNGGATWTNSRTLDVALDATDTSGVASMCLSATATCSTFVTYAATTTFTASTTAGLKTVYATFKDTQGNTSVAVNDTISYDGTAPLNGTLTATPASGEVALSWSGFTDTGSGLDGYKVVYGTTLPASCAAGTVGYEGATASTTITGLTDGTSYGFRVCALDVAGNTSTGVTATVVPAPEYDAPTGTVTLNAADAWTRSRTVDVSVAASDASDLAQMCVSASTSCTAWKTYAEASTFSLPSGEGVKTVRVWVTDEYGNQSAALEDTISVDTVAPSNGAATATPGTGSATVSWTGFADATSGIASYQVVVGTTTAASCTAAAAWSGAGDEATLTGLASGVAVQVRVCALDTAGNKSTGAIVSVTPQ